jgi:RHS repeat-associated protein
LETKGAESTAYVRGLQLIRQTKVNGATAEDLLPLQGHLGTTLGAVDLDGNLVEQVGADAFGNFDQATGFKQAHLYTGEYWDQDAQLLYLRARWYDPRIGRFISADPFEGQQTNPRSLNRYAYSDNDPANNIDPSGRMTLGEAMAGLQSIGIAAVRVAAPVLYAANYIATRLGSANIAQAVTNSTAGVYQRINLSANLLRLDAGRMWETLLKPAMEILLRATPQVTTYGARADWVWRGRFVIDAKLGQYINLTQAGHFARFAADKAGSVTYIALTRPPAVVYDQLTAIANRYGVNISVYWLLP